MELLAKVALGLGLIGASKPPLTIAVEKEQTKEHKYRPRPGTPRPVTPRPDKEVVNAHVLFENEPDSDDDITPVRHANKRIPRTQSFVGSMSITRMGDSEDEID